MDLDRLAGPLQEVLAGHYGPGARVRGLARDSGGASRVTCAFDAVTEDGTVHPLILRLASPGAAAGIPLTREAALMRAARAAGVPSPRVVAEGDADGPLGAEFVVMERVEGETIPRRVLRDPALAGVRPRLAARCGEILAAVHRIPADAVPGLDDADQLAAWREVLDLTGRPHPALEFALRWLDRNRPPVRRTTVVHGDFRNGNLIVGPDGVRAVLDWELAHLGDPLEDLGWLCVKAWRFGAAPPVGGFGSYDQLTAAYEEAGGGPVDRDALRWWEMFGVARWAVICVMQAQRHLTGGERSVELAAIGRRVAENEWDLLRMMP
ncbi:phosphotransferase family protein [Actinomadura kijaniata]|uniref:Aminoglycoside phosphotransferase (APT) family kinase protein n=1 Tax=Actinomadura namibiensis TaxID=182080 RepID=A0A7W3QMW7_ACTNM|nr:phosphotransferase family protein [Actinomadura namibiensis]MBA8952453.1 aminoglycoside phosphotransferase (APT) family kinase protein [Actinomadura namibiensis]